MPTGIKIKWWIGPGLIMAATGIGASDIISATVAGAKFGVALLWALALGTFFKFVLTEGLARWQLATGTTLLEGWANYLPRGVMIGFACYLLLWAVAVSGALVSGCGLAVETISNGAIHRSWAAAGHAVVAFAFIYLTRTDRVSKVMKPLIAVMFFSIVACAIWIFRDPSSVLQGLVIPAIPAGGEAFVLSLIGGIGGSLTLLNYNYLLHEEGRVKAGNLRAVRTDLTVAYLFTAIFGGSVMMIANRVFHEAGVAITDREAVSRMADQLAQLTGPAGFYVYAIGFWAAVLASLFGVWRVVPTIFADCYTHLVRVPEHRRKETLQKTSKPYRGMLIFMALVSLPFAFLDRPLLVVVAFTVIGSLFIPFLAVTLLYLNNRVPWKSSVPRNGMGANIVLVLAVLLFLTVAGLEIVALL